jgi:GNAT superfamily N-acetyltransferase
MDTVPFAALDPPRYEAVRAIYEASFPARQREPFDQLVRRARTGGSTGLVGVLDGEPIGFASWSVLTSVPWAFIEFVAVDAARRGAGLGSALWSAVLAALRTHGVPRLVLEVEDSAEADDEAERLARDRRVRFYLRAGARMLPVDGYVAPNLDGTGVERFRLMWQPVTDPAPRAAQTVPDLVRALLTEGYGLPPDHPLVRATDPSRGAGR